MLNPEIQTLRPTNSNICKGKEIKAIALSDTTDQIGISWPCKWPKIYDFIDTATKSDNSPPMAVRDNDEDVNDNEIYNEELLRVQRS